MKFGIMEKLGWLEKKRVFFRDCMKWIRIWKSCPVLPWIRAAYAYREENFSLAAQYYRQGLKEKPKHPASLPARFDLAYCLEKNGEPHEAISVFSTLIDEAVDSVECYLNKSRLENYLGRHISSLETLRKARRRFPEDIRVIVSFMHTSLVTGFARDELLALKEFISSKCVFSAMADEQYLAIETALAHYELLLGDANEGDRKLVRVLASGDAPSEATLLRGRRMLAMGRVLQARELFRRAMIQSPGDPEPLILLSESYLESEDHQETIWAIQLAETACKLSRWKRAEAIALLGRAYERNQESDKAELYNACIRNMSQAANLSLLAPRKGWWGRVND
ncbi:MAG TPA: hypothetical protein PKA63_05295 [Oligoflexia bacterium]|nr:hypothetical protein [Oligoflexia bacterium]HMP48063.1 hypothetical protein [Oligoflexia bacterium]